MSNIPSPGESNAACASKAAAPPRGKEDPARRHIGVVKSALLSRFSRARRHAIGVRPANRACPSRPNRTYLVIFMLKLPNVGCPRRGPQPAPYLRSIVRTRQPSRTASRPVTFPSPRLGKDHSPRYANSADAASRAVGGPCGPQSLKEIVSNVSSCAGFRTLRQEKSREGG
jgi:hypothetical protein